jgi:hypothetical protein
MYARVVRFSGVTREQIDSVKAMVEESDGPPPGVDSTGMKLVFDESQGTGVFMGFFETEEAMKDADEVLRNMDAGATPGTRESIDQGEVVIERDA